MLLDFVLRALKILLKIGFLVKKRRKSFPKTGKEND